MMDWDRDPGDVHGASGTTYQPNEAALPSALFNPLCQTVIFYVGINSSWTVFLLFSVQQCVLYQSLPTSALWELPL